MAPQLLLCHIISSFYPIIGGAEKITENLLRELHYHGAKPIILTRHYRSLSRKCCVQGIDVVRLGLDLPKPFGSICYILHSIIYMFYKLKSVRLIHVHNFDSPFIVGILAKLLYKKRLIVTIHIETHIAKKKKSFLGKFRIKLLKRLADKCIALTKPIYDEYIKIGIPKERLIIVPNSVDVNYFCPPPRKVKYHYRKKFGFDSRDCVILYVGRLISRKRVDLLINILGELKGILPFRCLIIGNGPQKEMLYDLITKKNLINEVFILGSATEVLPFYQVADIFVLPSLFEGLSVALLEAMAMGLCVIAADSPGNSSIIRDGIDGLLFPVHRPNLLKNKLISTITDVRKRNSLGKAARRKIVRFYSISEIAKRYFRIYKSLEQN